MTRISVTLDDDQTDWVEQEADRRDRSRAAIIRQCITAVRTDSVHDDPPDTSPVRDGVTTPVAADVTELVQRVDDLEARVAELEAEAADRSGGHTPTRDSADSDQSAGLFVPAPPQGSDGEHAVVEWVREYGPVERAEIVDAFEDEWSEQREIKPRSWWERHAKPALDESGAAFTRNVGWELTEEE